MFTLLPGPQGLLGRCLTPACSTRSIQFNAEALAMTKDQMRALLADLVPAAIADGRAYVVRRPAGKAVREVPNDKAPPNVRAPRPRRIYPRQGVYGAGFEVETYKTFQQT